MVSVMYENDKIIIKTPYNEKLVSEIKSSFDYRDRRFDYSSKTWTIYVTTKNYKNVQKLIKKVDEIYETDFSKKIEIKRPIFGICRYDEQKQELVFVTEYDSDFISDIKKAEGKWNGVRWSIKSNKKIVQNKEKIKEIIRLYEIVFKNEKSVSEFLDELENKLKKEKEEKEKKRLMAIQESYKTNSDIEIEVPKGLALYPYQKACIEYIEKRSGNVLIADEQGLGKTIEVLTYLYNHKEDRPVLVVCPAIVKEKWRAEIKKWCPNESVAVLYGKSNKSYVNINANNFVIINYDILSDWREEIENANFKVLILDESHKVKNQKAKRTKIVLNLSKRIAKKLLMTGTPIVNRPKEIWTSILILNVMHPNFKNFITFAKRYCDAKQTKWGWDFDGSSNEQELQEILREKCMIRRTKEEVLRELPEKIRNYIPITIDMKRYLKAVHEFRKWYSETYKEEKVIKTINILGKIELIRQLVNDLKYSYIINYIRDIIEEYDEKVIVYGHHKEYLYRIYNDLKEYNCGIITGDINNKKRTEIINENNKVLLCSIQASGVGIDLIDYNHAVFVELTWSPSDLYQAEDRLHRIGQKKAVLIDYIIAQNTIESYIAEILETKKEIIDKTIEKGNLISEKQVVEKVVQKLLYDF